MKPIARINFDEVFANSKFMDELSVVIYGAELALRHANASDAQIKEISNKIARSAFDSFSLNYDVMSAAAQTHGAVSAPTRADSASSMYAGLSESYSEDESDYYAKLAAQSSENDKSSTASEAYSPSSQSYHSPVSSNFDMDDDENFGRTVVYDNTTGSVDTTNGESEQLHEYEKQSKDTLIPENWDEGLGKIRWTTYSTTANSENESQPDDAVVSMQVE